MEINYLIKYLNFMKPNSSHNSLIISGFIGIIVSGFITRMKGT